MSEQENQDNIIRIVAMACEELADNEAIALNMALLLGYPLKEKPGYEKIAYIFNEDGTMHDMTREALETVLAARINEIKAKQSK